MNNPPRLWTTDHPNKIAGAREPSVGEVVVWLREQNVGHEVDRITAYVDGAPPTELPPGRYLVIPLDTEPPKENE